MKQTFCLVLLCFRRKSGPNRINKASFPPNSTDFCPRYFRHHYSYFLGFLTKRRCGNEWNRPCWFLRTCYLQTVVFGSRKLLRLFCITMLFFCPRIFVITYASEFHATRNRMMKLNKLKHFQPAPKLIFFWLYKLATKNLHLATKFLQLVAKRRSNDFFNFEPCVCISGTRLFVDFRGVCIDVLF